MDCGRKAQESKQEKSRLLRIRKTKNIDLSIPPLQLSNSHVHIIGATTCWLLHSTNISSPQKEHRQLGRYGLTALVRQHRIIQFCDRCKDRTSYRRRAETRYGRQNRACSPQLAPKFSLFPMRVPWEFSGLLWRPSLESPLLRVLLHPCFLQSRGDQGFSDQSGSQSSQPSSSH